MRPSLGAPSLAAAPLKPALACREASWGGGGSPPSRCWRPLTQLTAASRRLRRSRALDSFAIASRVRVATVRTQGAIEACRVRVCPFAHRSVARARRRVGDGPTVSQPDADSDLPDSGTAVLVASVSGPGDSDPADRSLVRLRPSQRRRRKQPQLLMCGPRVATPGYTSAGVKPLHVRTARRYLFMVLPPPQAAPAPAGPKQHLLQGVGPKQHLLQPAPQAHGLPPLLGTRAGFCAGPRGCCAPHLSRRGAAACARPRPRLLLAAGTCRRME